MPKKFIVNNSIVEKAIEQAKDVEDLNQLRTLLAVILPAKYPVISIAEVARILGVSPVRLSQMRAAYIANQDVVKRPMKVGGRRNEVFSPEEEVRVMDNYRSKLQGLKRGRASKLQVWIQRDYKKAKDNKGELINEKASKISLGSVYNLLKRDDARMALQQQPKGAK